MDQYEYRKKQLERQRQLLNDMVKGVDCDPDIWNLKYMLTEIAHGDPDIFVRLGEQLERLSGKIKKRSELDESSISTPVKCRRT